MPPSFSAERVRSTVAGRAVRWPAFPYDVTARLSLWVGVVAVAALFGWGACERRWIADDGLIVLRTVRNLLAGNGPVFNMGERVEANTSTIWTYLIYLGGWIGGQAEYVMVPYADFNLLRFPDKEQAKAKILDLTMLTDILPTGFHGAVNAGVQPAAATACEIRDSIRPVQVQCLNQHGVDWREHGFHASELGAPLLATRGTPVGSCGVLVHYIQSYFAFGQ